MTAREYRVVTWSALATYLLHGWHISATDGRYVEIWRTFDGSETLTLVYCIQKRMGL